MTRPPRPDPLSRSSPRGRGFTLIEVLIALGLSLILVSAIYSAISLHWRYETAGRDRIERAQISTAVLRLMTEDIGSVAFKAPDAAQEADADSLGSASTGSSSSTGAASSSGTSTSSSSTSGTGSDSSASTSSSMNGANSKSTTTASAPTSLGIVGKADYLQLDISRPAKEDFIPETSVNGPSANAPVTPELSSNVRVVWAMATPTMGSVDSKGVRSLTSNPALARQMTDRLRQAVEPPTAETNSTTAAPQLEESNILAKEIVSLSFQYYDGYSWSAEWDSTTMERLPRAIEVTIGFLKPEHRRTGAPHMPGSETILPIKHVILVPASSPVSGEEL